MLFNLFFFYIWCILTINTKCTYKAFPYRLQVKILEFAGLDGVHPGLLKEAEKQSLTAFRDLGSWSVAEWKRIYFVFN